MRAFIVSLLISIVVGWALVAGFDAKTPIVPPHTKTPTTVSVLGMSTESKTGPKNASLKDFTSLQKILAQTDSSSPDQLRQWLMTLSEHPEAPSEVIRLIVAELSARDPAATFELLTKRDSLLSYYSTAIIEWAKQDHSAALDAYLTAEPEGNQLREILLNLNNVERRLIYDDLVQRGFDRTQPRAFTTCLSLLASTSPEEMTNHALALRIDLHLNRDEGIKDVLSVWFRNDRDAVFEWIVRKNPVNLSSRLMETFAKVSVEIDGVEGLDRVWDLLNAGQRKDFIRNLPDFGDDMAAVLEWADQHIESPVYHQNLLKGLLDDLEYSTQPERMADILSHLAINFEDYILAPKIRKISEAWAHKNIDSFEKWMETIDNKEIQNAARDALISYRASEDVVNLVEQLKHDPDTFRDMTEIGDVAIEALVNQLFDASEDKASDLILEQLPEEWRDQALKVYASRFAEEKPLETLQFLETQPEGYQRDRGLQLSFSHWADQSPQEAAEWVQNLDDNDQKLLAARNLGNIWARSDPQRAIAWAKEQPASPSRNQAVEQIIRVASPHHPFEALSLAKIHKNADIRDKWGIPVIEMLIRRDPDLAEQALRSIELSPDVARHASHLIAQEKLDRQNPPE